MRENRSDRQLDRGGRREALRWAQDQSERLALLQGQRLYRAIGLVFLGALYPLPLGLVVGVTNVISLVGPWIGGLAEGHPLPRTAGRPSVPSPCSSSRRSRATRSGCS